ncbi:hypothetical protein GCM10017567_11490 [Amycolatopsis bullii]|uniref:Uncharacterized protein n=1 Tax=Amycolatopsis bullii TaxID=941987 RepID=A0ABQ3K767_9PSEU|nr:hypothetical protein GCM10017567_11490 [Amycolatopsis bullii]
MPQALELGVEAHRPRHPPVALGDRPRPTPRKHECDARCRKHQCNGLANNTVRKIHAILSGAYTMALGEWEWWTVNPIDGLTPPSFEKSEPNPPSATNAAAIVNEAFRRELAWGVFVFTSMVSGTRRGEAVSTRPGCTFSRLWSRFWRRCRE